MPTTVSIAEAEVVSPTGLLTTARYWKPFLVMVAETASDDRVAPARFVQAWPGPRNCHWYTSAYPVAETVKLAARPAVTGTDAGGLETMGPGVTTVSVATADIASPPALRTRTRYWALLWDGTPALP